MMQALPESQLTTSNLQLQYVPSLNFQRGQHAGADGSSIAAYSDSPSTRGPSIASTTSVLEDLAKIDFDNIAPMCISIACASMCDCPLIAVSKGFLDISGYDRDEVLGINCRFLNANLPVPSQVRQSIRNVCAAEGGENEETECRVSLLNRRKNGSLFYNQLLLKHIYIDGIRFVIGFQNEVQSLTDYQSQAGLHSVMHTLQNLGMRNYVRRKFLG